MEIFRTKEFMAMNIEGNFKKIVLKSENNKKPGLKAGLFYLSSEIVEGNVFGWNSEIIKHY